MDLVLIIGPSRILEAYGGLGLRVLTGDDEVPIRGSWDVTEPDEVEEFFHWNHT